MNQHFTRDILVAGTFNLRDLGGYSHPGGMTRWRRILRSGGLHRLDAEGIAALGELGVTTVIDLRHAGEHEAEPNPLRHVEGIAFHAVSLFEGLVPEAAAGSNVLRDLYFLALDTRAAAFVETMERIAAAEGTVLFHCTAGKDRTGLIAALLLGLAGVSPDHIAEDYGLTGPRITGLIERLTAEAAARGEDIERFRPLLACDPQTMVATLDHLDQSYGGAEAYLAKAGLSPSALARLRARLSEDM